MVNLRMVSPDYRSTLEIPLLAGRDLELADRSHPGNALISAQTARTAWPGEDPIGKHFDFGDGAGIHTVAGVVADARVNDLKKTANMVYVPYWENPRWRVVFLVRSSLPAAALANWPFALLATILLLLFSGSLLNYLYRWEAVYVRN